MPIFRKRELYEKDNDLKYKPDRTATPDYGKSISSKVTQADNKIKSLTNKKTGATIKSDYNTFSNDKKLQFHINKHLQEYPNFTKNDYVKKAHNLLKAKPS